jgi:predicted DNA-binding transcriptional regulator AlpA
MPNTAPNKPSSNQVEKLLKIQDVMDHLGCARSKVYALIDDGTLPKPLYISSNMPRFRASEYIAAIEKLSEAKAKHL